jgi:hypothetical protein
VNLKFAALSKQDPKSNSSELSCTLVHVAFAIPVWSVDMYAQNDGSARSLDPGIVLNTTGADVKWTPTNGVYPED